MFNKLIEINKDTSEKMERLIENLKWIIVHSEPPTVSA